MKTLLIALLALFWGSGALGQTLYTFNGGGTGGNWTDPTIWTTDPTGSTSLNSRVPVAGDNVIITNSFVVSVTSAVTTTGLSVTIQRGGMLDLTSAAATLAPLGSLSGQGTLRVGAPYFPRIAAGGNNFDDAGTGTVEFYNWPTATTALPIPKSGQYNNLRLLNTTATAYVAQLDSTLALTGGLTLTRTSTAAVTLSLGKTASANRTLTIGGSVTVGAGTTLGVSAVTGTHVLSVSGSFVNNGTVNLHNGTTNDNQVALLNFTGATDANFACNGPTDLNILQVNKGIDSQVLLNITSTVNPANSFGNLRLNHVGASDASATTPVAPELLWLVNGVAKLGNNVYLAKIHNNASTNTATNANTNTGNWFQLGSSATSPTLWLNGGTVVNDNATTFVVYGTLRVSAGLLQTLTPDAIVVREDAQVLMEGGTVYCEKFRPSLTSANHRGSFIMTGGTFECRGASSSAATAGTDYNFARFAVPYLTQAFRMTGGIIRVFNTNNYESGIFHIGVNPNNAQVTGGTIEVNLPNTNNNGQLLSTAPLWNLTIKRVGNTGTSKVQLASVAVPTNDPFASPTNLTPYATTTAQPLTVLNNLMLDGTNGTTANPVTFDANAQNVTIQGSLIIAAGSTYLPGANTTTFSGGQDQLLTNNGTIGATAGAGTFNNWTINKSAGTLTLGGSATTYYTPAPATFALLKGVLNDGGKTINVLGSLVNSASHSSGGGSGSIVLAGNGTQVVTGDGTGVFGNLTLNSTAAAGAVGATLAANMTVSNVLSIQSTNLLAIGANRLAITNVDPGAIDNPNGFTNSCFIQTAGNQSDLGLQKTWGGPDQFTFPVGTGTKYAPATISLRLATGLAKYGQVSVSPVTARSPFATSPNSLAYYWKVRSTGFGAIPTSSVNANFRMTNADAGGTLANYIPGRYLPVAWFSISNPAALSRGTTTSTINFNNIDQFDGEFTAGEPAAFGAITAFYSRASGNWEDKNTWSTTGYSGAVASTIPGAGNPVFVGTAASQAYHTVAVTLAGAKAGSLVIDRGSTLDVGTTTGHNFGALPDAKIGGSGRLRVSSAAATAIFPGGDFGSFIQYGGGTVEYYTSGTQSFTVPATSGSLTLNQYRNLWLNAASSLTVTLPAQDLRVYAQLKAGVANGATTYPGTVLVSAAAAGNLRADSLLAVQGGTLRLQGTNARSLTVDTDVRIDAGARFDVLSNAAQTHALTVGGSLVNNGTLDFKVGTGQAGLTFGGSQDAYLTSAGTLTDLYALTVNKGLGRTALLNLDGNGTLTTPANNWLTLTNGTLRYAKPGATLTIHDGVATPYLITDNAGLTVDASGGTVTVATNNNAAADLKLAGQLQILQGTLKVGVSGNVGNDLEYASAGAPGLTISGGSLYVNGQIRRTVTNLDGSLRFDQSGGTIDVDGQGATAAQNNERGLFEVQGPKSIFRLSGGTLNLHRSNQKSPILTADLYLAPDSTVVTGGTVVLGNAAAGVGNVTISVNSTVPLYDLQVAAGANATSTNTGLLAGVIPLSLQGSLTIGNDNSFFNANGLGLNIDQHLYNNNSSANTGLAGAGAGGFQPGTATQTTTFTGNGPVVQLLTSTNPATTGNLTVFGSLVVSNAQAGGTLQLGRNARTVGTLTLAKGTLADNGQTLTALGDVVNNATHTSTGSGSLMLAGSTNQNLGGNHKGRFGNLVLSNAAGATTLANQEITGVLTLTSGVLTIGSNLLWLSNPAAGAVAGFGSARFIRTNGIVADLGVRKSYPAGALNFTFPVGAAAKYTPAQLNVTSNPTAGYVTVQPIDLAHPSTTGLGLNKITFYWKVSSTLSSPTVTQQFTYGANDVLGNEALYKLGRFYGGAWVPVGGLAASTVNAATHTLSNPSYTGTGGSIDGDYTGGEPAEFGAVRTYYSRNATAGQPGGASWTSPAAWTFNADGTDSSPLPTLFPVLANPVVIRSGHLISSPVPSLGAATLQVLGTLDLGIFGANNFNTVSGTGTVRIGSALFPAGNYAAFTTWGGGTVDYSAPVQLPARDTYNNLTFSGGNSKQLSNLDLTINGALTVAAGTTVSNPTNQSLTLTSATSGATVGGTLNLGDGLLTTAGFLNLTSTGTLNLGAGLTSVGTSLSNAGTLNNGSGSVVVGTAASNSGTYNAYVGSGSLSVGTTFGNSGTYNAGTGSLLVNSDLTNAAGGIFTSANGDVTTLGSFTNSGTYLPADGTANTLRVTGDFNNLSNATQAKAGQPVAQGASTSSFAAGPNTLLLRGNFLNTGSFDPGTSLVQLLLDDNHSLTGSTIFYDLQKGGAGSLTLGPGTNVTVADLLTMRNGLVYTGTSNILTLSNAATQPIVGAGPSTYVAGRLAMSLPNAAASIRTFPVGLGGRYRPVTLTPQGTSSSPVVLVEIFNGSPLGTLDATLSNISANRYYRVQLLSGTITNPTVQLSFNTDVVDEEVHVPGNLRVARSNGPAGPWSTANGAGVFSPADPRGYTTSAATTVDGNSFFALASTNKVDNPLTGAAPLPVELVQFTATRQATAVRVAWATASERNSAYFVVQRSADGRSFAEVARVAAQGSSATRRDYATLDAAPLPGLSYYRLQQVDRDGPFTYSAAVAVRFEGQAVAASLVAYPNPVAGTSQRFQLQALNLPTPGGTVQLLDNVGRLVLRQPVATGAAEVSIEPRQPLAPGLYFATWQALDGQRLTTKVVVE